MDTTNKLAEAERPKFEAYIRKDCGDLSTFGYGANMHYRNSAVNNAWLGWLERAKLATPSADQATQPAEAVAEFNNGSWRLRIGSVWMTAPNPPIGPEMVNEEYKVKMYAARINAEIKGGVAAFGCDVEARGLTYSDGDKISRCSSWCGLDRCAVTLKGDLE